MTSVACALCGVLISRHCAESWTKEFRAVYTENDGWDNIRLSGIGVHGNNGTQAPKEPQSRYDSQKLTPDSSVMIGLLSSSFDDILHPDLWLHDEPLWGFGFHPSCYHLLNELCQPFPRDVLNACLSMPMRNGGILDWGHDYAGAALLDSRGRFPGLYLRYDEASSTDPIRFDPMDIPAIREFLGFESTPQEFSQSIQPSPLPHDMDAGIFRSLPPEILEMILLELPSQDVRSLRMATRTFAEFVLTEAFWASRFLRGREYHHVLEVRQTRPKSWRAMYESLASMEEHPNLVNRKRIWGLAIQLQHILGQMGGSCHGRPLPCFFEPLGEEDQMAWRVASRGLKEPEETFNRGSRALRNRIAVIPKDLEKISVSFVKLGSGSFISGLQFQAQGGSRVRVGFSHPDREVTIGISSGTAICGWKLAFHETGVKAISLLFEDGTSSLWVGEHDGFPQKCLSGDPEKSRTIKAQFDALKLVSLGIPALQQPKESSLQEIGLWSPDIPPKHFLLNGSEDDFPIRKGSRIPLPFSTVVFGGSDGQDLSQLVEIIGWVFDVYSIMGLQFLYTDSTKNKSLGRIGPFSADTQGREAAQSEDFRIPFPIDGPNGERMTGIELQDGRGVIFGLKIKTNRGREVIFPPDDARQDAPWTEIDPRGSTVVGLYSVFDRGLSNMGLMSIDSLVYGR